MPNGKLTLEEFKNSDEGTRQFYIWERLNTIAHLNEEIRKLRDWQKQIVGAMVVLNVFVLPVIFIVISKWVE